MLRKVAGLVMAALAIAWLIFVWREYVTTQADALSYAGWVLIFALLWGYNIFLRDRQTPEALARSRILGLLIFIPVVAWVAQRMLGMDFPMIEMAAALSIFGLFLSWGWRLYREAA
jgi:hypothetical protein